MSPRPPTNGRPATPEEAERRFFARYGAIVGGESWLDVREYLGVRAPKPTTVEAWFSAAEAVRDAQRMRTTPAADVGTPLVGVPPHVGAQPPSDTDRLPEAIADVEPAPPSPVEHVGAHAVSHQPRPRAAVGGGRVPPQPIPTAARARSAARRALK